MREYEQSVHEAIQGAPDADGSILTRWVSVAEWMLPSGERTLSRIYTDGLDDWELRGLLHEGLREGIWTSEEAE